MQSWGDLIVPPPLPFSSQLLGIVPRMTKESDVEAGGFCIWMIYLILLLFSPSMHRYNACTTKARLTLTIWPTDPRCGPVWTWVCRCRTCDKYSEFSRLKSYSSGPRLVYSRDLGLGSYSWECFRNSSWRQAQCRELVTSEMNGELLLGVGVCHVGSLLFWLPWPLLMLV